MTTSVVTGRMLLPRAFGLVILAAGLYAVLQHTHLAPFSHRLDDAIAGVAVGGAVVYIVAAATASRHRSARRALS